MGLKDPAVVQQAHLVVITFVFPQRDLWQFTQVATHWKKRKYPDLSGITEDNVDINLTLLLRTHSAILDLISDSCVTHKSTNVW